MVGPLLYVWGLPEADVKGRRTSSISGDVVYKVVRR